MPSTTKLLLERVRRPGRRRVALILLLDLAAAAIGAYWIFQWAGTPAGPVQAGNHTGKRLRKPGPSPGARSPMSASRLATARREPPRSSRGRPRRKGRATRKQAPSGRRALAGRSEPPASSPRAARPPKPPVEPAGSRDSGPRTAPAGPSEDHRPDASGSKEPRATPPAPEQAGSEAQSRFLAEIRRVFRRTRAKTKRCYEETLKLLGRPVGGRVHLRFRIGRDGRVEDVRAVLNTTGSRSLARCLLAMARRLRFPPPPNGRAEFLYPLAFRAAGKR